MSNALGVRLEQVPTPGTSGNSSFVKMGETAYFFSGGGLESLKINADGSAVVKSIHPVERPNGLVRAGNSLFYLGDSFSATSPQVFSTEVWKSDGTFEGTTLVKKFPADSLILEGMSVVGNSVFFVVSSMRPQVDGSFKWTEQLWKADGLSNACYVIKEFEEADNQDVDILSVQGSGGVAYFIYDSLQWMPDGSSYIYTHNRELWKTDGSPGNATRIALPEQARVGSMFMHDEQLYFGLVNNNKQELWATDGSQTGTRLITVITPDVDAADDFGSYISFLDSVGNFIYFQAGDGVHNVGALWKTDGTANGTEMLRDTFSSFGPSGHIDEYLTTPEIDNSLFFVPEDLKSNDEMGFWKTNGTPSGTVFVKDPALRPPNGYIRFGAVYNKEGA
jgi:ELWxxDGT repeat protein